MKRNDAITLVVIFIWCVVAPLLLWTYVILPAAEIHGY